MLARHELVAIHFLPANFDSPDAAKWKAAVEEEFRSLEQRSTWTLVPRRVEQKLVDSKLVFKIKRDASGAVTRYKARLVLRGFMQEHGIDYTETFAPTVRMCAIRVLLSLAAYYDWEAEQLDVVTAFLEAPVEEEIHMKLPEGFKKYDSNGQELVCKLHKSLYGLKQAPRNWNLTITQWLVEYGFIQSKVDPGIYVYHKGKLT